MRSIRLLNKCSAKLLGKQSSIMAIVAIIILAKTLTINTQKTNKKKPINTNQRVNSKLNALNEQDFSDFGKNKKLNYDCLSFFLISAFLNFIKN